MRQVVGNVLVPCHGQAFAVHLGGETVVQQAERIGVHGPFYKVHKRFIAQLTVVPALLLEQHLPELTPY